MSSTALNRLISLKNLFDVCRKYKSKAKNTSAGIDGISPKEFYENLPKQLNILRNSVREGYQFSSLRGVLVPKKDTSKFRIICIPTIQDRILQRAILEVIESRSSTLGIANDVSYGFVKSDGETERGVISARSAAKKHRQIKQWAFKTDISAFFDRIPRQQLIEDFSKTCRLKSITPLIQKAIQCEVDDKDPQIRRILAENGIKKGRGLRQGMPLSPILSNFLLRHFDYAFSKQNFDMVRYADDLIVFASSREECAAIKELMISELTKLDLNLSDEKTEVCDPMEPVEFLGMELGLNSKTEKYVLTISDRQIEKIRQEFAKFHDVDFCVKKELDLSKLLRRLENMKSGYRAAYWLAENFDAFNYQLDVWAENCINRIYTSIFKSDVLSRLTKNQRQFLLLPSKQNGAR